MAPLNYCLFSHLLPLLWQNKYVTCSLPYMHARIVIVHAGSNTSGFYLIRGTHDTIAASHIIMAIVIGT